MPETQRLFPIFGANTENAATVGSLFGRIRYAGIAFSGGFCEVPHIQSRMIVCNDLHQDIINTARCIATSHLRREMLDHLRWLAVSDSIRQEAIEIVDNKDVSDPVVRATAYFVTQWMGRSAQTATDREMSGKVPVRKDAGGGGTAQRYWTAVRSIVEWGRCLRRCDFTTLDWQEFLREYGMDESDHGYYFDPPSWPGRADNYTHKFTESDHRLLRDRVCVYKRALIVLRYGDHPLVRELYPGDSWNIAECKARTQQNNRKPELIIWRN